MNVARLLRALDFAALKHRDQRRKDVEASPYINHCIAVAKVLADEGGVTDEPLLAAAVLHDTVEDTQATFEEIESQFGAEIAELVREVTDDKALPKQQRKRLQIEHARDCSPRAKQLKLADKICNLQDMSTHPPADWPLQRRQQYVEWANQVAEGCRGVNTRLDRVFDAAAAKARQAVGQ